MTTLTDVSVKEEKYTAGFGETSSGHRANSPCQIGCKPIGEKSFLSAPHKSKKLRMEQQRDVENFSHFRQICKGRFASGGSLALHPTIHGAASTASAVELNGTLPSDEDFQSKLCSVSANGGRKSHPSSESIKKTVEPETFDCVADAWGFDKHTYPTMIGSASKSIASTVLGNPRVCDGCGKEFSSWKALFGHAMCHSDPLWKPEDERGLNGHGNTEIIERPNHHPRQRMRGNGSKRPGLAVEAHPRSESNSEHQISATSLSQHNEEEELAECLVMLSTVKEFSRPTKLEEDMPATSASTDSKVLPTAENASELDQLRPGHYNNSRIHHVKAGLYECTACMKKFHSFQALGGHRASHKKVKVCCARRDAAHEESESLGEELISHEDLSRPEQQMSNNFHNRRAPKSQVRDISSKTKSEETLRQSRKTKVHKCSICHRVFGSGQALGGHKRCHWTSFGTNSDATSTCSSIKQPKLQQLPPRNEWLDLNLPASVDEGDSSIHMDNKAPPPDYYNSVDNETDSRPSIIRRHIQPPWTGSNPKHGLLLYNYNDSHLDPHPDPDDEADSKSGNKSGLVM